MFGFVTCTNRLNVGYILASFVVKVLFWSNFSNVHVAAVKGTEEQCLTLNVSGSVQSVVNGQYELNSSFGLHCNSHPVWTKSTHPTVNFTYIYIYYQEDGFDGWIISTTSCYSWGNFIAGTSSDSLTPYNDAGDGSIRMWQESINGTTWTDNHRLVVRCGRYRSPKVERELSTDGALMIALYIVCTIFVVAVILITVFFLSRPCRKKDKQASLSIAVVSDPSFRYQRVQTDQDDVLKHATGTGNQPSA